MTIINLFCFTGVCGLLTIGHLVNIMYTGLVGPLPSGCLLFLGLACTLFKSSALLLTFSLIRPLRFKFFTVYTSLHQLRFRNNVLFKLYLVRPLLGCQTRCWNFLLAASLVLKHSAIFPMYYSNLACVRRLVPDISRLLAVMMASRQQPVNLT